MGLRASEWVTVAYFAYLAGAAAVVRGIGRRRRRRAIGTAVAVVIAVLTVAWFGTSAALLRDGMPLVYILLGYWLPALLVTSTNQVFERRLLTLDQRWLGIENGSTIGERAPRRVIELLELAYLFCYPMVPIGFACLYVAGLREESDRFWTAVLAAVFGCYGVLPWLPTRPPRAIEGEPRRSSALIRRVNLRVLGLASVQLNTFPSGHVAASLATALAVGVRLLPASEGLIHDCHRNRGRLGLRWSFGRRACASADGCVRHARPAPETYEIAHRRTRAQTGR